MQVVNTTTETDLFRTTVAADTLKLGSELSGIFGGTLTNNSGGDVIYSLQLVWGVGYGIAQPSGSSRFTCSTSTSPRRWLCRFTATPVTVTGGLNNDLVVFLMDWKVGFAGTDETRPVDGHRTARGESVRDVDIDNDLALTATMDTASASASIDLDLASIRVLP